VALKKARLVSFCSPANAKVTPRKARRTSSDPPARQGSTEHVTEGCPWKQREALPCHLPHPDWHLQPMRNVPGTQIALVSSPSQSLICRTAGSRRSHARESSVRDEPDANITEMADFNYGESGLFAVGCRRVNILDAESIRRGSYPGPSPSDPAASDNCSQWLGRGDCGGSRRCRAGRG